MGFSTRNAYYLRISATTILPLYLYLDERHVEWMSDHVLQHVLADLRPLIIPKLNAEADIQLGPSASTNAKRGTLDVHRGDTYQFGYFLRGTEPHAVLVKTRTFTAAPPRSSTLPPAHAESSEKTGGSTRSRKAATQRGNTTSKKRKPKPRPKGKGKARAADEGEEAVSLSSDDDIVVNNLPTDGIPPRRSKRARKAVVGGYIEDDIDDAIDDGANVRREDSPDEPMDTTEQGIREPSVVPKQEDIEPELGEINPPDGLASEAIEEGTSTIDVDLVDEEDEPKPKPILHLRYHGFNIHGRCLCIIVEPYPPLRSATRAPSLAPTGLIAPRAPSIALPDFAPSEGAAQRARTPLFLPEHDREPTPAPFTARTLPPVPLFSEAAREDGSDEEEGEMVLFSQILRSVGDHPPGIAEDDDEIDGAVFFGDADEMREL